MLIAIAVVALMVGCAPKIKVPAPQINLPAPQINVNVPQPQVNVGPQQPQVAPQGPQMQIMVNYAPVVFYYAFSTGGYWIWLENLKPGDWVKFDIKTGEPSSPNMTIEKAFLKVVEDGKQWWRVTYTADVDTLIYEVLFSPDMSSILRVRAKATGDTAPSELPVTENMGYAQPLKLTKESIEGATVGFEQVTVPAGTFTARHVKYGVPGGGGTLEWWLVEDVPGGVIKYRITDPEGKLVVEALLESYGSGATTILNSY